MDQATILKSLNSGSREEREAALYRTMARIRVGEIAAPEVTKFVNNHIHTTFSFSPYSPTAAAYMAYMTGLETAGIMDHDSVGGVEEFLKAGDIIGMPVTNGCELRVRVDKTPLADRRINNPDQKGVIYTAFHGIPRNRVAEVEKFLAPYRAARNVRNRQMVTRLNAMLNAYDINVDFDADVLPLSQANVGGSITERHLLFATANKMISAFGRGDRLLQFLQNDLGITIRPKIHSLLADVNNIHYAYDLLGLLKSDLVEKMYIPATDECPDVKDYIAAAHRVGAIAAYPYLGDVGDSVTGDKKMQKFEDDYLDELFDLLKELGYDAITYMPSRNTPAQLERLMGLCRSHGFFEISGEDINSPRQSFICPMLQDPAYAHLYDATYALIGHELAATADPNKGMFGTWAKETFPSMPARVAHYAELGKNSRA